MSTITQAIEAIQGSTLARATVDLASARPSSLGPKQIDWLRLNVSAFRHMEEQRQALRADVMRAARLAGLS